MMKKCFFALIFALMCGFAPALSAGEFLDHLPDRILFYVPNRILDILDTFSVSIGVGPAAEARLMATRLCDVGAGYGMAAKLYKNYNRQYGAGVEEFWYWSLISIGEEHYSMLKCTDWVDSYSEMRSGIPDPTVRTYDFFTGARDYWALTAALGCFVTGEVSLHPFEWLDCALGFFLIDIKNDDLTLDSFSK